MANLERSQQRRRVVAIDGAMTLIIILLIVQIWLLSATLETFLRGHAGAVFSAAIFSGLAFLGLAVDLFVTRVDQEPRKP
jgi:threonine/homoserine/homoserine lactone efflux protein